HKVTAKEIVSAPDSIIIESTEYKYIVPIDYFGRIINKQNNNIKNGSLKNNGSIVFRLSENTSSNSQKTSRVSASFSFCSSTGLPIPEDRYEVFSHRPCVPGETVIDSSFIVDFKLFSDSGLLYIKNVPGFQNYIDIDKGEFRKSKTEYLSEFSGEFYHWFVYRGDDFSANLRCNPYLGRLAPRNPKCTGLIWDKELDFIYSVGFPSDQGRKESDHRWKRVARLISGLLTTWRIGKD
ncbi:MAG: hypothetical protein AAF557_10105, partial [Pseudomonadota bacterium]